MEGLAELMRRYVEGDSAAFSELYGHVSGPLLGYLVRMSGRRDVAEDLLQDSMIKAHRARRGYVAGTNPMPWLYTIAHRTFLDHARKQKRARVRPASDPEALPQERAILDGSRETDARAPRDDAALAKALQLALAELPVSQRQAIIMTKLQGQSLAAAAEAAGTTVGAMKLRVHRAYTKMRKRMAKDRPGHGE